MLPSRGLTRAHGLVFQNQILSRAPARSITRQITPTSRPAVANARQFGTSLRSNAKPFPRPGTVGFLSGGRIGAAGLLSSQTILLSSTRRFASTDSTDPTWANASTPSSELDADFSAFPDLDTSSLMDIPEKVGYLSNLGLDYGFGPTTLLKYVLENLHFTAGLPWWGAIVGMAIMARAALVYPALIAQQESFKSRELRQDPLYRETQAKFMQAMIQGSAQSEMLELRMQMKLLQEGAGIKTWKMFLPVVIQIPLFVGGMRLMRTMAALPVPGLDSAGVLWFTDLTVPDPLYILPLVGTAVMILGIRRALPFMNDGQAQMLKWLPWVLGPISIAVIMNMSGAVQLFLAVMALGQYVQTTLWNVPWVRRLCNLPPLELMMPKPGTQQPRVSPFSRAAGVQYQAPRTINTTATEGSADKPAADASGAPKSDVNPFTYFMKMAESVKEAKGTVSDKVNKYKEKSSAQNERKQAAEYERRRAKEEHEKYQARREERQYKREQRRLDSEQRK